MVKRFLFRGTIFIGSIASFLILWSSCLEAVPSEVRKNFLEQAYQLREGPVGTLVMDMNTGRTQQYPELVLPQAPILHTYNPVDHQDANSFHGVGVPIVLINVKFPSEFQENLPASVKQSLEGKNKDTVEVFWVVQNNPWTDHARILLRPHYWLNPHASSHGHNTAHNVEVHILEPEGHLHLAGNTFGVSVHLGEENMTISSPDNIHLEGSARKEQNYSFWSLTTDKASHRTAVTLHWVVNEHNFDILSAELQKELMTLEALKVRIDHNASFQRFGGIDKLEILLAEKA